MKKNKISPRVFLSFLRNDMLWSSLEEPQIINTNEFAELFAKATSPTKRKPLSEAYEKKTKARKVPLFPEDDKNDMM